MRKQKAENRERRTENGHAFHRSPLTAHFLLSRRGFTLIETLVAISILMLAIIPPMSLTIESITAAYYARDQVTASNLAQEGIEVVRSVRDGNILKIAEGNANVNIFDGIPLSSASTPAPFTVDSTVAAANALTVCPTSSASSCAPLQTNGSVYAYKPGCNFASGDCGNGNGWTDTIFTRSVTATLVNSSSDELRITVTVTWREGAHQVLTFPLSEDLYRWVNDDSGA